MFRQLSRELVVDRPNKRKLDASDAEVPAAKKPRVILPLKQKSHPSVTGKISAPKSITHTLTPIGNPAANTTINVSHSLHRVVPPLILHAPTVPTIHEPTADLKATTTIDEERLTADSVEPHQSCDDMRSVSVTIELDNARFTEPCSVPEPKLGGTTFVQQSRQPATKVDSVSMNITPSTESDREARFLEGYASSDSTAVEMISEEADVATSKTLAGSESVASSEPGDLKSVPETKHVLDVPQSHGHVPNGSDDTSGNDEPLVIVSHRLAHLAVPGAAIAKPEILEDVIEVLPWSAEEEEDSA